MWFPLCFCWTTLLGRASKKTELCGLRRAYDRDWRQAGIQPCRDKDLKEESTSLQGIMLSHRKKCGGLPMRKEFLPSSLELYKECLWANQIYLLPLNN